MTAPFAPPMSWEGKAILWGFLVVALAIPFGRREDWIGWAALSALLAVVVGMWALLIRGMAFHTLRWWRQRAGRE